MENTNSTIVSFVKTEKYAGGRSHVNKRTLKFADGDIFRISENMELHVYPINGEDFEGGVTNSSGSKLMDADEFASYTETGIGALDFGETVVYSRKLKDVDVSEFRTLSSSLQLEYLNLFNEKITDSMLQTFIDRYSVDDAFELNDDQWLDIIEELES